MFLPMRPASIVTSLCISNRVLKEWHIWIGRRRQAELGISNRVLKDDKKVMSWWRPSYAWGISNRVLKVGDVPPLHHTEESRAPHL